MPTGAVATQSENIAFAICASEDRGEAVNRETMRFRRKRLILLAVGCVVIGLPFVLASRRGAVVFDIGATLVGIGGGLLVVALIFAPLSRLNK